MATFLWKLVWVERECYGRHTFYVLAPTEEEALEKVRKRGYQVKNAPSKEWLSCVMTVKPKITKAAIGLMYHEVD